LVGKLQLVKTLLQRLEGLLTSEGGNDSVKSLSVDTFLGTPLVDFSTDTQAHSNVIYLLTPKGADTVGSAQSLAGFNFSEQATKTLTFGETAPKRLESLLENASLPYITSNEQIQLALIVDCMNNVWLHTVQRK
jgi:RAVE protein 1 C terminal